MIGRYIARGGILREGEKSAVHPVDLKPKTISLSILVLVEMFNAFNAISENESLLQMPPWVNPYLIIAIVFSMTQHVAILSIAYFQKIFQVAYLTSDEWWIVVVFSFPVIIVVMCSFFSTHRGPQLTLFRKCSFFPLS